MTWKLIPWSWNPRLQAMWQQSSWVPLPYCFLPRGPLPNKISCFVSTCVSLDNSFPSVRQEPSFGPWKGSPFLQQHWRLLRSSGQGCFWTYGDQWSNGELYLIWFSQYFSVLWLSVIILIVCCDLRNWFSDPVRRDDWWFEEHWTGGFFKIFFCLMF